MVFKVIILLVLRKDFEIMPSVNELLQRLRLPCQVSSPWARYYTCWRWNTAGQPIFLIAFSPLWYFVWERQLVMTGHEFSRLLLEICSPVIRMWYVNCILIPVMVFTSNAPAQTLPHLNKDGCKVRGILDCFRLFSTWMGLRFTVYFRIHVTFNRWKWQTAVCKIIKIFCFDQRKKIFAAVLSFRDVNSGYMY